MSSPREGYRRLVRNMRNMAKRKVVGPSENHRGCWELDCSHVVHATNQQAETGELCCPQCPTVREPTDRDQRRLAKGEAALQVAPAKKDDLEGLKNEREALGAAVVALQSMDDLGTVEANQEAMAKHDRLLERLRTIDIYIEALKSGVTP